jgi:cytochrome c peroxidase
MPPFPDNPTTVQGVALGRRLFHDPILSGDGTQSCASCHQQVRAFGDTTAVSLGIHGDPGTRNAQVVVNPGWQQFQFWDGRRGSLEDQARDPVVNPVEMASEWSEVEARIAADPTYPPLFTAAFGSSDVTQDRVVMAIAQFERTFVSANSRYDRKLRGEVQFTEAEARGEALFFDERAECSHCHAGPLLTDGDFHDIGLDVEPVDPGRAEATEADFDRGKFKTPTLRNVARTAPYMHDGRFSTLEEVLGHYAGDIKRSTNLDATLGVHLNDGGTGLGLTVEERADLIAFLRTLTDEEFLTNPAFGPPPR